MSFNFAILLVAKKETPRLACCDRRRRSLEAAPHRVESWLWGGIGEIGGWDEPRNAAVRRSPNPGDDDSPGFEAVASPQGSNDRVARAEERVSGDRARFSVTEGNAFPASDSKGRAVFQQKRIEGSVPLLSVPQVCGKSPASARRTNGVPRRHDNPIAEVHHLEVGCRRDHDASDPPAAVSGCQN